jgi:VanZ family protein
MIFAIVTELVQKFVAGRSFNPNDMYYNVIGIMLGLVLTMTYFKKQSVCINLK